MTESSPRFRSGQLFAEDLRAIREERGVALKDIIDATRLAEDVIEQFERTALLDNPVFNRVYLRSLVSSYARQIDIDENVALQGLEDTLRGEYEGALGKIYLGDIPEGKPDEDDEPDDDEPDPGSSGDDPAAGPASKGAAVPAAGPVSKGTDDHSPPAPSDSPGGIAPADADTSDDDADPDQPEASGKPGTTDDSGELGKRDATDEGGNPAARVDADEGGERATRVDTDEADEPAAAGAPDDSGEPAAAGAPGESAKPGESAAAGTPGESAKPGDDDSGEPAGPSSGERKGADRSSVAGKSSGPGSTDAGKSSGPGSTDAGKSSGPGSTGVGKSAGPGSSGAGKPPAPGRAASDTAAAVQGTSDSGKGLLLPDMRGLVAAIVAGVVLIALVWISVAWLLDTPDEPPPEPAVPAVDTTYVEPEPTPDPVSLPDTFEVRVIARDEPLDPIRSRVDNDLRRPYWVELGDTLLLRVAETVILEREVEHALVVVEEYLPPEHWLESDGTYMITRERTQGWLDSLVAAGIFPPAAPDSLYIPGLEELRSEADPR